ncbi:MAG: aminotransferase class I/II-fold pyridoxal phosphate-dependent enzyme, partial [Gammaproteobacteria bacterium]|nr:aminotransferase class I/II-fold pyridoxal phosphate-dependent enzyme [Gammaproteobacteria bacterium]
METEFIPFSLPSIGEEEINEVVDTLRSGWLTTGPKTRQFEEEFAQYVGVKHAIAINSATAGLHLSLEALGISEGDKVVTTTYTFTATAEVVRYLGADPVFVDVDPITANIDIEKLAGVLEKIEGIKAIIPVHFAGQS